MSKKTLALSGSWSAIPTPLTDSLKVDSASVKRMVKHHIRLGQKGLFVGGTCGEGPFLPQKEFCRLSQMVTEATNGDMVIAVQVTDNSFDKVLENISRAKADGADIAVTAEPWFLGPQAGDVFLQKYYMEIADKSPLPIGIYSRGGLVSLKVYREILKHPNVCLFKDSSVNNKIMNLALGIAKSRNDLTLLTGYEWGIAPYLEAGYDGMLSGGGIIIGALTAKMIEAAEQKDFGEVIRLQEHCNKINYIAYGGKKIKSWLTGLKYTLVKMGVFKTTAGYLQYPLSESAKRKIDKMVQNEKEVLMP